MEKIEHIGIAVQTLSSSIPLYEKLLNTKCYKEEVVEDQKVRTAFFKLQDTKIELLEATSLDSVIHKFIEKHGEGLHHIAYEVADINAEIQRLKSDGFSFVSDQPSIGADNKLVCFIYPRDADGVLTEICQEINS